MSGKGEKIYRQSGLLKKVLWKDAVLPRACTFEYKVHTFKRGRRGLFGGKHIKFGNKISMPNNSKTRRSWKPNAVTKRLYSPLLEKSVKLKITTSVIKDIDHAGGIDEYILKRPHRIMQSDVGSRLKLELMNTLGVKRAERKRENLAQKEARTGKLADVERAWLALDPHIQAKKVLGLNMARVIAKRNKGEELTEKQIAWIEDAEITQGNVPDDHRVEYKRPIVINEVEGYTPRIRAPEKRAWKLRNMHSAMAVRNRVSARLDGYEVEL